jgi:hypothetical protein
MYHIVKSCFGKTEEEYLTYLDQLLVEHEFYKSKDIDLLGEKIVLDKQNPDDSFINLINFMMESFTNSQRTQFPTENIVFQNFPAQVEMFSAVPSVDIPLEDMRVYLGNVVYIEVNKKVADKINKLTNDIRSGGMTDDIMEQIEDYKRLVNRNKSKDISIDMSFKAIYEEKKKKNLGMVTGIEEIDKRIGGITEGTLTTIAGFTSHFKTTFALNVAHRNTYFNGYNLIYLSFETPKEDMLYNYLCRHSYERHFTDYPFIPHEKIRRCELTPRESDFLYNAVEPDLSSTIHGKDGNTYPRGKLIILDERDFNSMSFTDLANVFESIDDQLGGRLHGFIVDYIQLCKFTDNVSGKFMDDNRLINSYVTFFRRLTQKFRSGDKKKMLIGILLSQINRENWKKASKREGRYDLTCLADANELERGSYRVLTTYTTEDLKAIKVAQLQILKNRGGATMWEPSKVYADGESYVFGDEMASFGQTLGGGFNSGSAVSALDELDDLGDFGL